MCLLVKSEIIISNAFFAGHEQVTSLDFSDLKKFCDILYDEITNCEISKGGYKYVYFQADEKDVDDFCSCNNCFIRGIDKVYRTGNINSQELSEINSIFTEEVQLLLKNARRRFSQSIAE